MIKPSRTKQPRDVFIPGRDNYRFASTNGRVCLICGEPLHYVLKMHAAKHGYTDREKFIAECTAPMSKEGTYRANHRVSMD